MGSKERTSKRTDNHTLLTKSIHKIAIDDCAEETANGTGISKRGLPGGRQLVLAPFVDILAILFRKGGVCKEVADQDGIVPLVKVVSEADRVRQGPDLTNLP